MPPDVHVVIQPGHAAEMDERWSVVGATGQQRWWWQAMDQHSGAILADGLGTPTDPVVRKPAAAFRSLWSDSC